MGGLLQNRELPCNSVPWLENLREKGLKAFEAQGLPSAKTEAWKYTRPRDLMADDFVFPSVAGENTESHCSCGEEKCGCGAGKSGTGIPFSCYEINIENGRLCHAHLQLPRGVSVLPLMDAVLYDDEAKNSLGRQADITNYPFAALNTAYLAEGLFIRLDKGVKLDKPLVLRCHTHACHENLFCNLRNVIILEKGASAEFVEIYDYEGAEKSRYFINVVNEISVGREAALRHYKLQNEAFKAVHIALSAVRVREKGIYKSFCLQRGANLARNESKVELREEKAAAEVNAAYVMYGWATIDTTTDIEHQAPETISGQLVKGIVGGDARGVFQGKIHIAPDAVKTEGKQLHKALLLSDTAEVDCKPELEIFADDVKCSHGAASGELDEEQLFYMRSRGISEDEARQMLIEAYLQDVLSRIENDEIREWFAGQAA